MFLCLQNLHPTYRLLLPSSSVPLLTALNLCFIHTLPSHSPSPTLPSVSLPLPALSVSPPVVQPFFLLLNFLLFLQIPSNLSTLFHSPVIRHQIVRVYILAHHHIFPYIGLQFLSSLKFCNRSLVCAAPVLLNGSQMSLLILHSRFLMPTPLRFHFPLLLYTHA